MSAPAMGALFPARRFTLGRFGVLTADQARKAAQLALAGVPDSDDPVAERHSQRTAPMVSEWLDRYLSDHVAVHNADKTDESFRPLIERHIRPRIGTLKTAGVTRQDIAKLRKSLEATRRTANLGLSILPKAFKAVGAYHRWRADRIVAESNQGGAMVENTVSVIDPNVSLRRVRASRGKIVRAEPESALYEQGRVHHLGMFAELEDQLCCFAPGSTDSPDRLDALVYALTEPMVPSWGNAPQNFHLPVVHSVPRVIGPTFSAADGIPSSAPPGGWAAGSSQAAGAAPFANLNWSYKP